VQIKPHDGYSECDADEEGDSERERGHPTIKDNGGAERQLIGAQHGEQADADGPTGQSEQPAADREQDRLEHDFASNVATAGSEGLADGELLGPAAGADQEEIDQVDAADEEQEKYAALKKK
jgi:hypothetical protein